MGLVFLTLSLPKSVKFILALFWLISTRSLFFISIQHWLFEASRYFHIFVSIVKFWRSIVLGSCISERSKLTFISSLSLLEIVYLIISWSLVQSSIPSLTELLNSKAALSIFFVLTGDKIKSLVKIVKFLSFELTFFKASRSMSSLNLRTLVFEPIVIIKNGLVLKE